MLNDLDETIKYLLIDHIPLDPGEVDVSFDVPDREWSASISKPTLNYYLYDIRENLDLRESSWITEGGSGKPTTRQRPPFRVDLSYQITAWTQAIEDEHTLLWHTLAVLMRFPILPEESLHGALREQPLPISTKVAQPDGVLKSPGDFWTALDNQLKPSLSYVVTLAMDHQKLVAGPPVFSWTINVGVRDQGQRRGGAQGNGHGGDVADQSVDRQTQERDSGEQDARSGPRLLSRPAPDQIIIRAAKPAGAESDGKQTS
jgi:hypothetical protein